MAAAIKCAWAVTTVSPSYMEELKENANGLESLLKHESKKCVGILNGIDNDVWNPETDHYIEKNYKIRTLKSGREANKKWLCKTFNLDLNKPLFAFIGRLVYEKGTDLLPDVLEKALEHQDISVLILGSGSEETQNQLKALISKHKSYYYAFIGYDEKLSHIIYAGADFLLMPSRVEPCGLNQMYSLRYGTIPIVNNVGGLKDTIIDYKTKNGFGIVMNACTEIEMFTAITEVLTLYNDKANFKKIRNQIMKIDHSWSVSAEEYNKLYKKLKN